MGNPRGGRGLIVGSPWGSGVDFGIPVGVGGQPWIPEDPRGGEAKGLPVGAQGCASASSGNKVVQT